MTATTQEFKAGDTFLSPAGVVWKLVERSTNVFRGDVACWLAECVGFAARPAGYGDGVKFDDVTQIGRIATISPQVMLPHGN